MQQKFKRFRNDNGSSREVAGTKRPGKSMPPFGRKNMPLPEDDVVPVSTGSDFFSEAKNRIGDMCGFDATNLEFPEPGARPVLIDLGSAKFTVRVFDITDEMCRRTHESGPLDDATSASNFLRKLIGDRFEKNLPFCLDAPGASMSMDVNSFVRIEASRDAESFRASVSFNAVFVDIKRIQ